ncbi:uncharacterized protein LOC126796062 [Argentina anserina]|uniref:uncharacterized protein LOC126796062 n=1 Tax=Argentina anserina TaxID=57926 RepID=UPI00217652E3|nr:uncharacterized protein LOC126796062 [Potentilla anserina]
MISIEDPHVQHREIDRSAMTVMPELTSFCTFIEVEQATLVRKDWKSVEACLSKHGYSCKLITQAEFCYCFMIVSKTKNIGDLDITDKIWDFLKLVSIELQPSKAIGILNGSMHCQFIPAGYECGGPLCSKFGVTEEQYAEVVWPRIQNSFEKLSSRLRCEFIVMPDFIAVFGSTQVKVFCGFVYNVCFRLKQRPALRFRGGWKSW